MTDEQKIKAKARKQKIYREKYLPAYQAWIAHYPFTLEDLDGEIWAWIAGYEGDYQESTYGRTKSFKNGEVKIKTPILSENGYLRVHLLKNGMSKIHLVHVLVAQTFIPNPDNLPQVDHRFGMKFDNSVGNLQWVTSSENRRRALQMELAKVSQGEDNCLAKLTNEQALYCRDVYIPRHPEFGQAALARHFGVSRSVIEKIVLGKSYQNAK